MGVCVCVCTAGETCCWPHGQRSRNHTTTDIVSAYSRSSVQPMQRMANHVPGCAAAFHALSGLLLYQVQDMI